MNQTNSIMKKEKEYFILISPSEEITRQINLLKRACAKYIGKFYGMKSQAHISFSKYIDEEDTPGKMSDIMSRFIKIIEWEMGHLPSCNLIIDGFDFFDHGNKYKTIYAVIKNTDETVNWFNTIKEKLFIKKNITPHITIAKKITVESFNILWPFFQKLSLTESFKPESLTILTREFDKPFVPYQKFKEISFNNSPS